MTNDTSNSKVKSNGWNAESRPYIQCLINSSVSKSVKVMNKTEFDSKNALTKGIIPIKETIKNKMEGDINDLWKIFVHEYDYARFLLDINKDILDPDGNTNVNENDEIIQMISTEVKYRILLVKNQISIQINNLLKSFSNEGSYLLSYAEIWIVHIKLLLEKQRPSLKELINIFSIAVEYSVSSHIIHKYNQSRIICFLFAFFIIYLMEYMEHYDGCILPNAKCTLPKGFEGLWNENRDLILSAIREGKYSLLFQLNDHANGNEAKIIKEQFLTPKPKKKKHFYKEFDILTDLKNAKVIDSNIRQNGNYALIELSQNVQQSTGHKYILTPINNSINKAEVSADLKETNDKYDDYLYQPYNELIALKVKDNERLSFG